MEGSGRHAVGIGVLGPVVAMSAGGGRGVAVVAVSLPVAAVAWRRAWCRGRGSLRERRVGGGASQYVGATALCVPLVHKEGDYRV